MLPSKSTKRGFGNCPGCSECYPTCWKHVSCAKCGFHLGGNQQPSSEKPRRLCPAAELILDRGRNKVFSVQTGLRDDHCFILQEGSALICSHKECLVARASFVSSGRAEELQCQHTTSCHNAVTPQSLFFLDESAILAYNRDTGAKDLMLRLMRDNPNSASIIQVSDMTYAVLGLASTNNTLGYVHVKKLADGTFMCTSKDTQCHSFVSSGKYQCTKKLCLHLHVLFCVGVCRETLETA